MLFVWVWILFFTDQLSKYFVYRNCLKMYELFFQFNIREFMYENVSMFLVKRFVKRWFTYRLLRKLRFVEILRKRLRLRVNCYPAPMKVTKLLRLDLSGTSKTSQDTKKQSANHKSSSDFSQIIYKCPTFLLLFDFILL